MKVNLHTHTFRCHHATGTPEEYIKRAIDNLPGNRSKGGSRPSNTGGEPPGLRLKTSHPRTGPKFPLISQMQTHRHREWMNPTQKMLPVRAESRQGEKKKKLITHNSLTDSLIWIH